MRVHRRRSAVSIPLLLALLAAASSAGAGGSHVRGLSSETASHGVESGGFGGEEEGPGRPNIAIGEVVPARNTKRRGAKEKKENNKPRRKPPPKNEITDGRRRYLPRKGGNDRGGPKGKRQKDKWKQHHPPPPEESEPTPTFCTVARVVETVSQACHERTPCSVDQDCIDAGLDDGVTWWCVPHSECPPPAEDDGAAAAECPSLPTCGECLSASSGGCFWAGGTCHAGSCLTDVADVSCYELKYEADVADDVCAVADARAYGQPRCDGASSSCEECVNTDLGGGVTTCVWAGDSMGCRAEPVGIWGAGVSTCPPRCEGPFCKCTPLKTAGVEISAADLECHSLRDCAFDSDCDAVAEESGVRHYCFSYETCDEPPPPIEEVDRWAECDAVGDSCLSCVDAGCAYIGPRHCLPSCDVIADNPDCYSLDVAPWVGMTAQGICDVEALHRTDDYVCASKNNCGECTSAPLVSSRSGETCSWHINNWDPPADPDNEGHCMRHRWTMMGEGYGECEDLPRPVEAISICVGPNCRCTPPGADSESILADCHSWDACAVDDDCAVVEGHACVHHRECPDPLPPPPCSGDHCKCTPTGVVLTEDVILEQCRTWSDCLVDADCSGGDYWCLPHEACPPEVEGPEKAVIVTAEVVDCFAVSTCSECLLSTSSHDGITGCRWSAGSCAPVCAMDVSCYYLKADDLKADDSTRVQVAGDKCLDDERERLDFELCNEAEAEASCDACVARIKSDGRPCAWHRAGGGCGSELCPWYRDCGITTCDLSIVAPTEFDEEPQVLIVDEGTIDTAAEDTTSPPPIVSGGFSDPMGPPPGPFFAVMAPISMKRCVPKDVAEPVDPNYCFGMDPCDDDDGESVCVMNAGGEGKCVECDDPTITMPTMP